MLLAYVDESGDSGYVNSPSRYFLLAVTLIHESAWLHQLDRLVAMRRYMLKKWGVPPSAELKAAKLMKPGGVFFQLGLSKEQRLDIYKLVMTFQREEKVYTTFAICIEKGKIKKRSYDPRTFAWQFALERIQNFASHEDLLVHLYPDAGHGYFIRRIVRQMRRHHIVSSAYQEDSWLSADASRIVEDPSDRDSKESYFIQLADLNAYAAVRWIWPTEKQFGKEMWDSLDTSRLLEVNKLTGGPEDTRPPGIKVFPQ